MIKIECDIFHLCTEKERAPFTGALSCIPLYFLT